MKLEGKVAIVTGSSRGIGKAIALAFAREGAQVVIAARTEEQGGALPGTIHTTAEEVRALGRKALAVRTDVTDEGSVEEMVRKTIEEFDRIDVLVNNAGISFISSVLETPSRRWDLIWRVNVRGAVFCSKAVLPTMIKQGRGSIINVTSAWASNPPIEQVPYSMTKAALRCFTIGLAAEVYQHNIAVNSLNPGDIRSEGVIFAKLEDIPWRKPPEVVGPAAVFLAAQSGRTFTGREVNALGFEILGPW